MFQKLRQRWGLSTIRVILVLCTFAVAGSLSGYSARKLISLLDLDKGAIYWAVYLVMVTLIWPVAVLIISIPFGQFSFFKSYLRRMAMRMGFARKEKEARSKGSTSAGSSDAVQDRP